MAAAGSAAGPASGPASGSASSGVDPPTDDTPRFRWRDRLERRRVLGAAHEHNAGQCPCSANFRSRHGVIVSSFLHPRKKLGAGGVLEAGGSGAGDAIEPMT